MRRDDEVIVVKYFTTIVKGEPDAARRQETYLEALRTHSPKVEVVRGHFKEKTVHTRRCRDCGARAACVCRPPRHWYRTYEEKLTDVALATEMVRDAAGGTGDLSLLISTDTDFLPAIHASRQLAPRRPVMVALPPGRSNPAAFQGLVTAFPIREEHLRASLLPEEVKTQEGKILRRPAKWS